MSFCHHPIPETKKPHRPEVPAALFPYVHTQSSRCHRLCMGCNGGVGWRALFLVSAGLELLLFCARIAKTANTVGAANTTANAFLRRAALSVHSFREWGEVCVAATSAEELCTAVTLVNNRIVQPFSLCRSAHTRRSDAALSVCDVQAVPDGVGVDSNKGAAEERVPVQHIRACHAFNAPDAKPVHLRDALIAEKQGRVFLHVGHDHHSGFFAKLTQALNLLRLALDQKWQVWVDFSPCSPHFLASERAWRVDPFFSAQQKDSKNILTYVMAVRKEQRRVTATKPPMGAIVIELSREQLQRLHDGELDGARTIFGYPYGIYKEIADTVYNADFYYAQRLPASRLLNTFFHPNDGLQRYEQHLAQQLFHATDGRHKRPFLLGVHLRGTDKHTAPKIEPYQYVPYVVKFVEVFPHSIIFVASDSKQYVQSMRTLLAQRQIAHKMRFAPDILRGDEESQRNPFHNISADGFKKAFDVVIDARLLSRCDFLLYSFSHVSEFAIYWSRRLHLHEFSWNLQQERPVGEFQNLLLRLRQQYNHG